MQKRAVSYEYTSFIVDLLAQRVGVNDYQYIIGIGRGGLIPASMLAYKLNRKVLALGIATYNDTVQTDKVFVYQPLVLPKIPGKFLVVDDICDTGNTITTIRSMYEDSDHVFEFASLFVRDSKSHIVDYYGFSVPENIWLDFAWEDK